uniref:Uncharacterized protein n=1 Tax=Seriola lalandi dorsalis TaxID=1841481 RepID=A0A3B4XVE6_SERLL
MKKTFVCNESVIITIPIGNLRTAGAGQLMPERFHCVFRDSFKVFVVKGKPKPLGAKLSFSLNIISFFWSIVAFSFSVFQVLMTKGICGLIMSLLVVENVLALFLIYWLSKAICREEFNTLPIILLKQAD